jgi:hypothetical protein
MRTSAWLPRRTQAAPRSTFQYDNDGLLTGTGALTVTRDPATGFVTSPTLGGTTETRTYNSYGEDQSYKVKFGTTVLYSVDYGTRDALGRIVTKTETIQGETHTYVYGYTTPATASAT